ncbi:hypothetical protein GGR57DRAFT_492893 [Xylariaceae sp. FL1272]|nr:hypothetical protein GGR57DRAFT_492893 [Xylariaceae sp. FL1272]
MKATEKNPITISHQDGKCFIVPWDLSQTKEGIRSLIKATFGNNQMAKTEIDTGQYKLYGPKGEEIIHEWWSMLVQPGWQVLVHLNSEPPIDPRVTFRNNNGLENKTMRLRRTIAVTHETTDSEEEASYHDEENEAIDTTHPPEVVHTIALFLRNEMSGGNYFWRTLRCGNAVPLKVPELKLRRLPILEEKTTITVPERKQRVYDLDGLRKHGKLGIHDEVGQTMLKIHSPYLLNTLRSIIKYSTTLPTGDEKDNLKTGLFSRPYRDLFHHKQELSDFVKGSVDSRQIHSEKYNETCERHIKCLLDYLDNDPGVQINSLEAMWAKKLPTTTFAGLWLLFKPGTDVYVEEYGQLNAYVVDVVSGGIITDSWPSSIAAYEISVWNLIYNGNVITRKSKSFKLQAFDHEKAILSLPLFPTRFKDAQDSGVRRNQLIERGKKVFQYAKCPAFVEFTGTGEKAGWKKYHRARVIIDHTSQPWKRPEFESISDWNLQVRTSGDTQELRTSTLRRLYGDEFPEFPESLGQRARAPRCECMECGKGEPTAKKYVLPTFADYDNIDPVSVGELSDHQYLLCMSHMFGFVLKDRAYDILDVNSVADVRFVDKAIDHLVMRPESNKNTVKAIVQTYVDGDQTGHFTADFIRGKGEGQIFLLHGPPGTGKTLTAESVAEYTKRPLLSITAADLGHEATTLENNLLKFFDNASSWDAIVLLDEADVYLERRSSNDIQRNSIVSVFLRAMDYFQGILFLTTNRIGHFDEAIMSRIHLAIGYEPLDDKAREQIWENLFRKLKDDHKMGGPEIRYEYEAKQYAKKNEEVRRLRWNGREIRNAFQTTVALAVHEAKSAAQRGDSHEAAIPEVKESHLAQVVKMSTAFKEYITSTHEGIEDADLAFKLGNRDDSMRYGGKGT